MCFQGYAGSGKKDDRLVAITAAMEDGTGLAQISQILSGPLFDVGDRRGTWRDLCGRTSCDRTASGICCIFFVFTERI